VFLELRYLAPAGAPIQTDDLRRWATAAWAATDPSEALRVAVQARFGVRHCATASTGRAGMTLLLRALRRKAPAGSNEVVLPTYTCYSVAASVVKAGFRVRLVDINPDTLDYDASQLAATDFTRVFAIVATNLYGLPNDLPALSSIARKHSVSLVDDAAQAMGATVGGRPCGTWGDVGLFSLDKGKNVSAIDGGLLVTDSDDVARALELEMRALPQPTIVESGVNVMKAFAYFALLRPWLYGIPARIPQLGLGRTVFSTDFALHSSDPRLMALGLVMFNRLDQFTQARVSNASALLEGLRECRGISTVSPISGCAPAYLRLPILCASAGARQSVLGALTAAGIGATASYPEALADVPELHEHLANPFVDARGGRSVATRIVTLPTHPFVTSADASRIVATVRKATSSACAA